MVATRKQTEIQSAAIAHCVEKSTGREFYAVKSDSSETWYHVTWAERAEWECGCPATKPCKHIRAVCEVIQARITLANAAAREEMRNEQAEQDAHFRAFQASLDAQMAVEWEESRKEQARAQYLEFEFQSGSYSHPWA